MSGIPQFNYPAFLAAAERLRDQGLEVLCPAEMDTPEMQKAALESTTGNLSDLASTGETWGDVLAKDVKLVADEVDEVCLLPGWQNSRGARLEAFCALSVQKPCSSLVDGVRIYYEPSYYMAQIATYTVHQGDVTRYVQG
jgi:hypothetical protein